MEAILLNPIQDLELVEALWLITNCCLLIIFASFLIAAWFCAQTFHSVGFGPIGNLMTIAMLLLAASFGFIGFSAQLVAEMALVVRLSVSLIGRILQVISSVMLAISFWKYYNAAKPLRYP